MVKKFALVAALMLAVAVPASAVEIRVSNHTQHRITDFWINGFHHSMNAGPFESQWTGAYTDNCGYHTLRAEASDGTSWNGGDYMCGEGVHTWNLYH